MKIEITEEEFGLLLDCLQMSFTHGLDIVAQIHRAGQPFRSNATPILNRANQIDDLRTKLKRQANGID